MINMQSLGIDRLSVAERLALVHDIWDSIVAEQPVPIPTDAQKVEFDRRIAELDADPSISLTWKEIKTRIQHK